MRCGSQFADQAISGPAAARRPGSEWRAHPGSSGWLHEGTRRRVQGPYGPEHPPPAWVEVQERLGDILASGAPCSRRPDSGAGLAQRMGEEANGYKNAPCGVLCGRWVGEAGGCRRGGLRPPLPPVHRTSRGSWPRLTNTPGRQCFDPPGPAEPRGQGQLVQKVPGPGLWGHRSVEEGRPRENRFPSGGRVLVLLSAACDRWHA